MDINKKISFGFNKLAKKTVIVRTQPSEEKKVELIDCLEGQSIKIKDAVEVIKEPLVIPIKDNKKNLLDRVKEAKIKREIKSENAEDNRPDSELTLEEQAARALINDAKNRLENNSVSNSKVTVLPIKEDKITIDGEEEPTLEDYENIPISDYGMAMLRGMGWKEGTGIGKNPAKAAEASTPELRPKGLGLGATRIIKAEEPVLDKDGNALILKKGVFAKIIAGSHKGNYCEVQGLDDEAGRVIVKTSLKGEILTLNEFLIVPVTQLEYSQGAKVLNNAKYEEYKEKSDKKLEAQRKTKNESVEKDSDNDSEKYTGNKKNCSSSQKMERPSKSSDHENNLSSENQNERKPRQRGNYKNRSESDEERERYKDKHDSRRNKYRDKQTLSSDSDNKYKKSRDRYRDSSDSGGGSRKNKSKDKKKKKDRHRGRSKSRKEKQKNKKSERSRDRSPSYDYKGQESSKKHKSKSRHRRRSTSSSSKSSDRDYRSNRR
ncbi:G-patch domain and KOW motifs-containing protein [Anoplophora glabripennis]|uniref:G-patch domain and KOW motifs-containing protein n=1 Tax=Anoplophora glabripennis TaxID=217634 RepID=UPI000874D002|nr:G-patch domain and KOW motifs-containing protein [Anoplophora glabripennis]